MPHGGTLHHGIDDARQAAGLARNRLRRFAQVFGLTPCAAGRILASIALMAGASAGMIAGATLCHLADPLDGRRHVSALEGWKASLLDEPQHVLECFSPCCYC